jgi:hypothetical protein
MTVQEILIDYLAKTLGKSNESLTDLLFKKSDDGTLTDEINEDALTALEDLHAEHVKAAPADTLKAEYDRGHQQGKFEALSKEEDTVRKKYGLESKGKLSQLIDEAVAKTAKVESSEDKILISPLYLKLKDESQAAIETLKAEYEAQITDVTTKAERQSRFTSNIQKIEAAMAEAGVVMPKNPSAAATLKREFLKQIEAFDLDQQETGTYLKDAEGKLQKDKHGHPITLESFVKSKAPEWFDIEKQPGRQTPGNEGGDQPAPSKWSLTNLPKTQEDFQTAFYAEKDPVQQQALVVAFEAANKRPM